MSLADKPAYPRSGYWTPSEWHSGQSGITLRQYYVGCALQGLCARHGTLRGISEVSRQSIRIADEVIAYLENEEIDIQGKVKGD